MEASWAVFQHSDPEGEANLGGGPHEIQPSPDLSMARTGTDTSLEIEGVALVVVLGVRWRRDERVVCNNNSNSNNNNPAFLAGAAAVVGEEGGGPGPLLQQERILMHS